MQQEVSKPGFLWAVHVIVQAKPNVSAVYADKTVHAEAVLGIQLFRFKSIGLQTAKHGKSWTYLTD